MSRINTNTLVGQSVAIATGIQEIKAANAAKIELSLKTGKQINEFIALWKSDVGKSEREKLAKTPDSKLSEAEKALKKCKTLEDAYVNCFGSSKSWVSRMTTAAKADSKTIAKFRKLAASDANLGDSIDNLVKFIKSGGQTPAAKQQAREQHQVERLGSVTVNRTKSGKVELSFNGSTEDELLVALINTVLAGGDCTKLLTKLDAAKAAK